ncbi:invasion associated locus B family protein [Devosia neptuniae]|uniref:Invasion associated locus B family protein n=1 Tax=Devosia neptuniae TaxID=191302 RepID=A0ABY6C9V3_9HYPH|nr:invasion associated locus B family protein [Devosia neptuniae]UXN69015.1 invasion associated locus B family protein [Devosia neptuniae]
MPPKIAGFIVSFVFLVATGLLASPAFAEGPVGQWYKSCADHCVRFQTGNGSVNSFEIVQKSNGPLLKADTTPDADLPFGVTWQIDGQKEIRVPFMRCQNGTCQSEFIANEDYLNMLRHGSKLRLSVYKGGRWHVTTISLAGFTAAYDGK